MVRGREAASANTKLWLIDSWILFEKEILICIVLMIYEYFKMQTRSAKLLEVI